MITIKAIIGKTLEGTDILSPETPIPEDAIRVTCDGVNYTVYQPGDTLPETDA